MKELRETLDYILDNLDDVKQSYDKSQWQACCPAHDDLNPSFSVKLEDDRILLYCHAGCTLDDILHSLDLQQNELFAKDTKPKVIAMYDYIDEQGNLLHQSIRYDNKDFRQRKPKKGGGWEYRLGNTRRVLYNLPNLIKSVKNKEIIYIVEGEKDADNLIALGLTATCNPMGAGSWKDEYSQYLRGADVAIIPDNDKQGQDHANDIIKSLDPIANSIKLIELPNLPDKGDVTDWLNAGGSKDKLIKIVKKTKHLENNREYKKTWTGADIFNAEFPEPVWVIPGMIPAGLSLLVGAPKLGKSWLALGLSIGLSHGGYALGKIKLEQAECLYLALEDTPRRIQNRLKQLNIKPSPALSKMHFHFEWERGQLGADQLESWLLDNPNVKLVIIDTLQFFREPNKGNSNIYAVDVEALSQLKRIADRLDIAILAVHHTRKSGSDDPLEMVSGSFGLTGTADTTVILTRARGQADGKLFITGRDVEEQELALTMDNHTGWTLLGDAQEYEISKERHEVVELLKNHENGLSPKEISEILDRTAGSVRRLLPKLVDDGLVKNVAYGVYAYNHVKEKSKMIGLSQLEAATAGDTTALF